MNEYRWIKNATALTSSQMRSDALLMMEAGFDAIETRSVIERTIHLSGDILTVQGEKFNLTKYKRICVLGFGKASSPAAEALEQLLGDRVTSGFILGSHTSTSKRIESRKASHPLPSPENVAQTEQMILHCKNPSRDDLFIVIISGGGSAMLCWPLSECEQGQRLYSDAIQSGMTIQEFNTVRKHLSELKGGGLASQLAPADVLGLIFSDVPGTEYGMVASGPTWPDATSRENAQAILDRYMLTGYSLNETPKDESLFEHVSNIVLVSNRVALEAMATRATQLGYAPHIMSDAVYDSPERVYTKLSELAVNKSVVFAGGEFRITVPSGGRGGRNTRATLTALQHLQSDDLFIAFASDGLDNSDACGAIADAQAHEKARNIPLDIRDHLARYDDYSFFEKTKDLIMTGPTGSNVSDLMMLLSP